MNGINASFNYYGVTPEAAYFTQPKVSYTGAANEKLEKIGNQKWVASYFQGAEAWFNWRRTGYPKILPSVDNQNDDRIPVRYIYPRIEQSLNSQTEMQLSQGKALTILIPEFGGMSIQTKNTTTGDGEHSPVLKPIL